MQLRRQANMIKIITILICIYTLLACSSNIVTNIHNTEMRFSNIQSNFIVDDINNYNCGEIDISVLNHVLTTGVSASQKKVHDHHSTTGCSIKGQLTKKHKSVGFVFDYGGIFYFDDSSIVVCAEECCKNNFEYCTWDEQAE